MHVFLKDYRGTNTLFRLDLTDKVAGFYPLNPVFRSFEPWFGTDCNITSSIIRMLQ